MIDCHATARNDSNWNWIPDRVRDDTVAVRLPRRSAPRNDKSDCHACMPKGDFAQARNDSLGWFFTGLVLSFKSYIFWLLFIGNSLEHFSQLVIF
jgi:hypothetical protein